MDTKELITEAKARFNHLAAKQYLTEKYQARLLVADQGGLWKADKETLSILIALSELEEIVLVDTFNNPIKINRFQLFQKLRNAYVEVMEEWNKEWASLENMR